MAEENKHYGILITDFTLHATKMTNPTPWYRVILKSFRNMMPGRIYSNQQIKFSNFRIENGVAKVHFNMPLPVGWKEKAEEMKKQGKEFTVFIPNGGIPFCIDKGVTEARMGKNKKLAERIWWKYNKK